jgi:hypothetical protein
MDTEVKKAWRNQNGYGRQGRQISTVYTLENSEIFARLARI